MFSPLEQFVVACVFGLVVSNYVTYFFFSVCLILLFGKVLVLNASNANMYFGVLGSSLLLSFSFFIQGLVESVAIVNLFWPWFILLCLVLACANFFGLLPFSFTLTAQIILPISLSFVFFVWINFAYLAQSSYNYFSLFLPAGTPLWLLGLIVPIEVLSYTSSVLSLAIRLFANMMSGHTLLKILSLFIFSALDAQLSLFLPIPVFIFQSIVVLEFGVAFLQIYVFLTLTTLYLKDIE